MIQCDTCMTIILTAIYISGYYYYYHYYCITVTSVIVITVIVVRPRDLDI